MPKIVISLPSLLHTYIHERYFNSNLRVVIKANVFE